MNTEKKAVSKMEGAQLDWAVAKARGLKPEIIKRQWYGEFFVCRIPNPNADGELAEDWLDYKPSGNWGWGGPIVEREICTLTLRDSVWEAECFFPKPPDKNRFCYSTKGETALIAAMRAFVVSRLGPDVEVPQIEDAANHDYDGG